MAYALELRSQGWDVKYLADVAPDDTLSRPEHKFHSITYPYPSWIVERLVRSQLLAAIAPSVFLPDIVRMLRAADVVFLSGLYLCLAKLLRPEQKKVFLSYGADLEVWCDVEDADRRAELFAGRIGKFAARRLVRYVVGRMASSLRDVDVAVTFPTGVNAVGDRVLARELAGTAVRRVNRYDISFADLPPPDRIRIAPPGPLLKIICGTRHTFRAHPGGTDTENKGTDIMIRGIGAYARTPGAMPIEVHLFEKGLDLAEAKQLCVECGIDANVRWHAQMPFHDYIQLHQQCHVAFDQLGTHVMGTGMYAMYLGMPVVANGRSDVQQLLAGSSSPLCHAENEADVVHWLQRLEDAQRRVDIGRRSQLFALENFGVDRTVVRILAALDSSH
ncbi:MAG: hypothetical protein SXG53_06660 [Pseudomonadota bacterium]|nr:hypothetical protein [Pseudomonadota bacterium]